MLTLDIDMPRMDGLEFLSRLMRLRPMPVVMISSLTTRGSKATMTALEHGAVDFLPKPEHRGAENIDSWSQLVVEKIRVAARAKLAQHTPDARPVLAGIPCASRASSLSAPLPAARRHCVGC